MKKMGQCFAYVLVCVAMLMAQAVMADDGITVIIDSQTVEFDVPPQIIDARTMVPMRKIFEELGAEVNWVDDLKLVIATYETTIISIPIGEQSYSVTDVMSNESKTVETDVPAQIIDGRTLVPLRAISEALGKTVEWDDSTRTVTILSE